MPIRVPTTWSPTFLVGCGRSGTTFLVGALNQHPHALALNEPRHIWRTIDARTDIWDQRAEQNGAKLEFTSNDATARIRSRGRRTFFTRLAASRKQQLIEKLPINNFRLQWIDAIFPTAKYLNLVRNGLDVARSIQQKGAAWHGRSGWKWRSMAQLCSQSGFVLNGNMPIDQIEDYFQRGLVEWTLSVSRNQTFLNSLDDSRHLTVRYEDLVANPATHFARTIDFLGLETSSNILHNMCTQVVATTGTATTCGDANSLPAATRELLVHYGYIEH